MKKPLITAEPASIFGEVPEEIITDPTTSMLHITGYSDKREAFELAQQRGEAMEPLTHRFHFVRHTGEAKRTAEFRANRYRAVMWDDCIDEDGNKKENDYDIDLTKTPAVECAPDGTVIAGDLQLMVVEAGTAAGIAERHSNKIQHQLDAGQRSGGRIEVREQSREVSLEPKR